MKASELRLGNLLLNPYGDEPEAVHSITISATLNTSYEVNGEPPAFFRPIPLTEEWLLKFGAVNADEMDKFGGFLLPPGIRILKDENGFYHLTCQPFGREIRLPFVHKLQNFIYEYTGTELTT